ncbi:membrane protein [Salmonella enterica subsp. enterica]|nr:membrane protein [Salmonella enterica subsp. enterica]
MGAFVTLFNYIGYRLMLSPWELSQAVVGLLSVAYLTGTWSSPKAGAMTSRYGRGPVMLFSTAVMLGGLLLTLFTSLWLIFAGILLFSAGFFAAHSVASSWIGPRARRAKGQASSLYLFSYYLGSSIAGTLGGVFWHSYGWNGVGGFIALMLVAGHPGRDAVTSPSSCLKRNIPAIATCAIAGLVSRHDSLFTIDLSGLIRP